MAADLGLVANAAEGDAHELAVEGASDGPAQRGFADARGADEAKDRAFHLGATKLADGQVLEDALFDLFQVVVILVENLAGPIEVVVVSGKIAPRQAGHPVEVRPDDRGFRGVGVGALQPFDLLLDLLPCLRGDGLLFDLLAVVLHLFGELLALAELGLNGFQLLAEKVLALRFVHLALRGGGDLLLHGEKVDLTVQELVDFLQPLDRIDGLEDLLGLFELEIEVRRGQVREAGRIVEVRGDDHDLGRDVLAEGHGPIEVLFHRTDQSLDLERTVFAGRLLDARDLGLEERCRLDEIVDAGARQPLHQDSDAAVGQLEHPHDDGHGSDTVQIVLSRIFVLEVLLRRQHDDPVLGQSLVNSIDRFLARH